MTALPPTTAFWSTAWDRWLHGDRPADVEAAFLRSLFSSHLTSSPVSIAAALFLYVMAPVLPEDAVVGAWVAVFVAYHLLRTAVGYAFLHQVQTSAEQLRRWGLLSWSVQLVGGMLMLFLALRIYPLLEHIAQVVLMLVVFIVTGSTAFSLAGRWATIAVYATPIYFGFAWAAWWSESGAYSKPLALLSLLLFFLYLMQARAQHRANIQGYALAHSNGELARELQVKNEALQEVASARSQLLATVSHDLRQPSHAIGLLCERALLEAQPQTLQQTLLDLNELSQSLSASLATLMDLTRLDAGLVRARITPVSLGQVLLRLEAEFAGSAAHRGLSLHVPGSDLWVLSDPVLLHAVLANLLSNAIKYTRQGRVDVELVTRQMDLVLSVRDTGMGIGADKLDLIFKEFVRLEGSTPGTEGLGIGLSIVRRYAALLGHELKVNSKVGQGSCFSIELPLVRVSRSHFEAQAMSRALAQPDTQLAGLRVLVVDNVDLVLSSLVRTMSAWGCRVHAATSLSEARSIAAKQALDLVISDFHLGDREPDGLVLIREVRGLQPGGSQLPCVLMTGDVSAQLEAQAIRHQVRILHKPVRPAVLQSFLLDLLSAPEAALTQPNPMPPH